MDKKNVSKKNVSKKNVSKKTISKIVASLTVILVLASIAIIQFSHLVDANVQIEPKTDEQWQTEDALTFHSYLDGVNLEDVNASGPIVDYSVDPSEPNRMFDNARNIAIVTVTSLDGAFINYKGRHLTIPATYGKMFVNKVLVGSLPEKEEINFIRSGAIMKVKDYYDGAPDVDKANYLRTQSGLPRVEDDETYEGYLADGEDSLLEVGKTYLAYIKQNPETGEYAITGNQHGSLLVENASTSQFLSRSAEPDLTGATLRVQSQYESVRKTFPYAEYFDKYIKDKQ